MPTSQRKSQLIYPWDILRSSQEGELTSYDGLWFTAVFENYPRFFDLNPAEYFTNLEGTHSHRLAEDIIAWTYKGCEYDAMWFTLVFCEPRDYPYVIAAIKLSCLVYSLTTGYATACATPAMVVKSFTDAYKDEDSDVFDTYGSCRMLLLHGMETAITTDKTQAAFNELYSRRIDDPLRRTIILCPFPRKYQPVQVTYDGQAKRLVAPKEDDFNSAASVCKIPEFIIDMYPPAGGHTSQAIEKAQPLREYKLFPNHVNKAKLVSLEPSLMQYFMESRIDVLKQFRKNIGGAFAHNINSCSDSLYVY